MVLGFDKLATTIESSVDPMAGSDWAAARLAALLSNAHEM